MIERMKARPDYLADSGILGSNAEIVMKSPMARPTTRNVTCTPHTRSPQCSLLTSVSRSSVKASGFDPRPRACQEVLGE